MSPSASAASACSIRPGVWIDVVEQIEPAAGWWDKYLAKREV